MSWTHGIWHNKFHFRTLFIWAFAVLKDDCSFPGQSHNDSEFLTLSLLTLLILRVILHSRYVSFYVWLGIMLDHSLMLHGFVNFLTLSTVFNPCAYNELMCSECGWEVYTPEYMDFFTDLKYTNRHNLNLQPQLSLFCFTFSYVFRYSAHHQ